MLCVILPTEVSDLGLDGPVHLPRAAGRSFGPPLWPQRVPGPQRPILLLLSLQGSLIPNGEDLPSSR